MRRERRLPHRGPYPTRLSGRWPCQDGRIGVEIPARADCVRGRRMATVAKCKFDLEVCGGIFVNEPCVVDGNLVSGRTYHDNGKYLRPWIEMLIKAREEAAMYDQAIV